MPPGLPAYKSWRKRYGKLFVVQIIRYKGD